MNIKLTIKSSLLTLFCVGTWMAANAQSNTGFIRGVVYKEAKPLANVEIRLYNEDGDSVSSVRSRINGEYEFPHLELGIYSIKVPGKASQREGEKGYDTYINEEIRVTVEGITINIELPVIEFSMKVSATGGVRKTSELEKDQTSSTFSSTQLKQTGSRTLTDFGKYASGVTNTRNGTAGRGSRPDATAVFIDGVRVNNSGLTQAIGGSVEILQAGIPAQYGDFTGLGYSITTKGGVSPRKSAGLEVRSSSMFNSYHHELIEGFYATPVLWKTNPEYLKGNSTRKKLPVAAIFLSGNFVYQREPQPSYIGYQVVKDDVLAQIEANPLIRNKDGNYVSAASYLTEKDFNTVKVRPNVYAMTSSAQAKFDYRLSEYATLTAFGNFNYISTVNGGNNILAYKNNPLQTRTDVLGYIKYTQTFKAPDSLRRAQHTTLNNTYFTLRFDYQSTWSKVQDNDHRDNIFDYGYIGQFKHYPTEAYGFNSSSQSKMVIDQNGDTVYLKNFWEQVGFRDTAITFTQADINRVRGNYTSTLFAKSAESGEKITQDVQIQTGQGLLNGFNPGFVYSLWNAPGTQLSGYGKSQSEKYTLFAMGETEVKGPLNNATKATAGHKLQFGIMYEQSVSRSYSLSAANLWSLMYQEANSHIRELDKDHPILSYDANGVFQDTVRYNRLVNTAAQSKFDKEFRNKLISQGALDVYGHRINESTFIDINSYRPSDFSLNMFSADELLNNGNSYVSYNGYDYLGKKVRGKPSVDDFLQDKEHRTIGAFMPIYTAAWFQDQFSFKDLEFRLGLRVERYDANQLVLKDPYSLYPIKQAGEVTEIDGSPVKHPSNIGNDYAVYVDDVKNPRKILGYRKDNTWYDENGTQLSSPDLIANRTSNGRIAPYLVDPNKQEVTARSFTDYKPKVNILPRVFFKFPLTSKSLFFASYDVLAQRPNTNFATIDDYYYLVQKNTDAIANPAMTNRITTDYQIGFRQQLTDNTLLSLISYYRETKNDISAYQFNNAYPITYVSFNNLDFSTVKGLIVEFNYKGDNNISLTSNYTLQFADGTGSNINSQRALIASNQPNLRSLFPLGDLDIRHQFKAILNWEFFDDKGVTKREKEKRKYLGPIIGKTKIFSNTNFNLAFTATSGLPYTATSQPVEQGSVDRAPIKGSPYGSRLPWQLNTNLNIQKDIPLNWKDEDGKSKGAYLQVYFLCTNLFNTKIVYQVYPYTGAVDDDGFLNSPKGQQAMANKLSAQSYSYYYKTYVNSPFNYQTPRMMYLGAKIFF